MTTVHVITGLPGSGKTSLARGLDALRFNLDDFRAMMGVDGDNWNKENEHVAVTAMVAAAESAVKLGRDIVIDNTHLNPKLPKLYRKTFGRYGVTFVVHDLTDITVDQCIAQDARRLVGVGAEVVHKMAARLDEVRKTNWTLTNEWLNEATYQPPDPYQKEEDLPTVILCDIDGTVAINNGHRGHYEYEKVANDAPNDDVIDLLHALDYHFPIIFLSGREDRCYDDTVQWLKEYTSITNPRLHMRATGDHRPDYVIKKELFDLHIRGQFNVLCVLDDRDQVVRLWRDMGLTCLQVAEGDF